MQTHMTHTAFEHCHTCVNLVVDVLYLEDGNKLRPALKNKSTCLFSSKNLFELFYVII